MGPAGKGDYSLLLLLPTTMMVLLQLGLPQSFLYFSARGQTVGLVAKSFVLTAALSAIGFASYSSFSQFSRTTILGKGSASS